MNHELDSTPFWNRLNDKVMIALSIVTIAVLILTVVRDHWVLEPRVCGLEAKIPTIDKLNTDVAVMQAQNVYIVESLGDIKYALGIGHKKST